MFPRRICRNEVVHREQRHGAGARGHETGDGSAQGFIVYLLFYFTVNKDTFSSQESCIVGPASPHPQAVTVWDYCPTEKQSQTLST